MLYTIDIRIEEIRENKAMLVDVTKPSLNCAYFDLTVALTPGDLCLAILQRPVLAGRRASNVATSVSVVISQRHHVARGKETITCHGDILNINGLNIA